MQLNKYLFEIKNILGTEDNRYVIRLIEYNRALYYRNKLSNGEFINEAALQKLSAVSMELVDQSDSPIDIPTDSVILRSVKKIPPVLMVRDKNTIFTVRNIKVLSRPFSFVSREEAVYSGSGRGNTREVFVFLHGDYLYVKIPKDNPRVSLLEYVSIEGLFTTPTEVILFNDGTAERDLWFHEYPIDDASWVYIKNLIINGTSNETNKQPS